jgi:hypothetical protein
VGGGNGDGEGGVLLCGGVLLVKERKKVNQGTFFGIDYLGGGTYIKGDRDVRVYTHYCALLDKRSSLPYLRYVRKIHL